MKEALSFGSAFFFIFTQIKYYETSNVKKRCQWQPST
jgi:hypothetical protein